MADDQKAASRETVVLLHGIGYSLGSSFILGRSLQREGYRTEKVSYPSMEQGIHALSDWLAAHMAERQIWETSHRVHFVTHSMGGLVSGFYLERYRSEIPEDRLGRVVMLGTPHGGSEVADALQSAGWYKWLFGPAGQELTTAVRRAEQLSPFYELGIIAGTKNGMHPLGRLYMTPPHDGCVSVDCTKLDGMTDHVVLPVMHGIMGWSPTLQKQVRAFLRDGRFMRS